MSENLSTIVSEKLKKDNFQAWKFRMTNFLMGKGVWPFINGDEQEPVWGAAPRNQFWVLLLLLQI